MPLKKAQNKTFSSEEDGFTDASELMHQVMLAPCLMRKKMLSQILVMIRNDFPSKISEVLGAIQDVKKEVQDFSSRLDEAGGRISKVSLLLALTNILSP